MRPLRHTLLVFVLLIGLMGVAAGAASANTAPGLDAQQSTPLFSSDMPFQMDLLTPSTEAPEGTLFACSLPARRQAGDPAPSAAEQQALARALRFGVAGSVISQDEFSDLRTVFSLQRGVLESDLSKNDKAAVLRAIEGGTKGGGQAFAKLLAKPTGQAYKKMLGESEELMKNKRLRAMVNPEPADASELRKFVPAGCAFLDSDVEVDMPGIGEMIKSPGPFMVKMGLYMVAVPFEVLFESSAPIAYRYSFFTPHSERGESMFNMPDTTSGAEAALGFDKALALDPDAQMERGGWLGVAVWMRAFISGFYILLIIVGAFVYMMRGSVRGKMNVLHMMPLVFLSALAMAATPVLIGYGITASNIVVGEIFAMPDTCTNAAGAAAACIPEQERVNMLVNSGVAAGDSSIKDYVFTVVSLASSAVFLLALAAIALLRQIALIVAVIASPLACFAIINRSWHVYVFAWVRITLAVVFLPVLMAVVMKIGLMLNPVTAKMVPGWTPADENTGTLFLGLLIMLATFYFMVKIPMMLSKGVIPRGITRKLGRSGSGFASRAALAGGPVGAAVGAIGALTNRNSGSLTTRDGGPGLPGPGVGVGMASRRGFGVGIGAGAPDTPGAVPAGQAALGAGQAALGAGQAALGAGQDGAGAGAGAGSAPGVGAGAPAAVGAAAAAGAAGVPAGAAGGAGAAVSAGAGASVSAPGATIAAGSVSAPGGAGGAGAPAQRQQITREEYDKALAEQREAVRSSAETGDPITPSQWLPVHDDGGYYLEYNEGYEAEMQALAGAEEAGEVISEPAGAPAGAGSGASAPRSGGALAHATAAAAAAVEATNAAAEESASVHGSSAPIVMGRSSATLDAGADVGPDVDMAGGYADGPGPAQTAFAREPGDGDYDDPVEPPPSGGGSGVSLPDLGDLTDGPSQEAIVAAWEPAPVPAADADLDDMFTQAPSLLTPEGISLSGADASVVSHDGAPVATPHLDMGDMTLADGAIRADVGDAGGSISEQISASVGAALDAHHERSGELVDAIDAASARISDATAAHGVTIAAAGERAAHQFERAGEDITENVAQMSNASDRLRETMGRVAEGYDESAQVMAEGTRVFNERAGEVAHLLGDSNNEMFAQLRRLSEVMSDRYGQINERVSALAGGVEDLRADDLPAIVAELGRSRGELDQMLGVLHHGLGDHRAAIGSLGPRIGSKVSGAIDDMGEQLGRGLGSIDELLERINALGK